MNAAILAGWRALVEWWKSVLPEATALLEHPPLVVALISIGLGGTVAYFLTERW